MVQRVDFSNQIRRCIRSSPITRSAATCVVKFHVRAGYTDARGFGNWAGELYGIDCEAYLHYVLERIAVATHTKVRIGCSLDGSVGQNRSCIAMKKIIKSRPMRLVTNKKALSSGFITSKSIRRTATVPYLFIHGRRFMGLQIFFAG